MKSKKILTSTNLIKGSLEIMRVFILVLIFFFNSTSAQAESFKDKFVEDEKKVDTTKSVEERLNEVIESDPSNPYAKAQEKIENSSLLKNLVKKDKNGSVNKKVANPTTEELLEQKGLDNPWANVNNNFQSNPLIGMVMGKNKQNIENSINPKNQNSGQNYNQNQNQNQNIGSNTQIFQYTIIIILIVILLILGFVVWSALKKYTKRYKELEKQHNQLKNDYQGFLKEHDVILDNFVQEVKKSTNKMINNRKKTIHDLKPDCRKNFLEVKKNDQYLLHTIDEVVEFLNAKSGRLELHDESIDINTLLSSVSNFISKNHKNQPVEISYEINIDVPQYFMMDFKRLQNMLISMMDYALIHSKKSIKLVVSKYGIQSKETFIEFKLFDTATPLDDEQKDKIFTPFNYEFAHKGLFLSKEIAKLMKGSFDIMSRENGNTLLLDLPLIVDEEREKEYKLSRYVENTESLIIKTVGIIDKNREAADILKKSFLHFTQKIDIIDESQMNIEDLAYFDLIIIEHSMINKELLKIFNTLQESDDLKVAAMHSSFKQNYKENSDKVIEYYAQKPITPFDALQIFLHKCDYFQRIIIEDEDIDEEGLDFIRRKKGDGSDELMLKQYLKPIEEAPNKLRDSLKDFISTSILFIEDDLMYQKMFNYMVQENGIRYCIATNKDNMLEELQKYYNHFNAIVLNIDVDNKSGYDIAYMIRKDKSYDNIPIFAMVDKEYDQQKILDAGINGYILKPMRAPNFYMLLSLFFEKININTPFIKLYKSEKILDITYGIMQNGHNNKIYIKLLKEFRDLYVIDSDEFINLIHSKNYSKLREFVLTMKNLSGLLGIHNIHQILKELEIILRDKKYMDLDLYSNKYSEEMINLNINIEIYMRSFNTISSSKKKSK